MFSYAAMFEHVRCKIILIRRYEWELQALPLGVWGKNAIRMQENSVKSNFVFLFLIAEGNF